MLIFLKQREGKVIGPLDSVKGSFPDVSVLVSPLFDSNFFPGLRERSRNEPIFEWRTTDIGSAVSGKRQSNRALDRWKSQLERGQRQLRIQPVNLSRRAAHCGKVQSNFIKLRYDAAIVSEIFELCAEENIISGYLFYILWFFFQSFLVTLQRWQRNVFFGKILAKEGKKIR